MDIQGSQKVQAARCAHRKPTTLACEFCSVRQQSLCRGLDQNGLAELNRISFRKRFAAGASIGRMGDTVDWCGVVVAGIAKLTKTTSDGRPQIVALQFPAEFLGQPFEPILNFDAEAATPMELCCFPRGTFDKLLSQYPGLAHTLLGDTMQSLDAARDWLLVLGRKTAEEKVASFILHVADRVAASETVMVADADRHVAAFDLPLSREEIGEFLGLRIETVSRQLSQLKSDGVIETTGSRGLEILKRDELLRRAEHG